MNRKWYYGLALLVFAVTMVLINGAGILLGSALSVAVVLLWQINGMFGVQDFILQYSNLLSCLIYMILAAVFLLWYYFEVVEKRGQRAFLHSVPGRLHPVSFVYLVLLVFGLQHLIMILMSVISIMLPSAFETYSELIETSGVSDYSVLMVIGTILLPPVVEEVIFRGLILHYLKKAGACFLAANIIQAVLFGIFHMNIVQGIYTMAIGLVLGYLAFRYETLLAPMVFHALFNLFGTFVVDLESRYLPETAIGGLIFLSVPLTALMFAFIHFGIGEKRNKGLENHICDL